MILSQTAQYALRAVLFLSEHGDEAPHRVDDIARALDVPRNYLSKILHVLARSGVLNSSRGPGGGFRLAGSPNRLKLGDVVEHFDAFPDGRQCLLGRKACSDLHPCQAHERWRDVASAMRSFLQETTIAELVRDDTPALAGKEGVEP